MNDFQQSLFSIPACFQSIPETDASQSYAQVNSVLSWKWRTVHYLSLEQQSPIRCSRAQPAHNKGPTQRDHMKQNTNYCRNGNNTMAGCKDLRQSYGDQTGEPKKICTVQYLHII